MHLCVGDIYRGQDKSDNGSQLVLESVSREVWHCVAQHFDFENAAQSSANLPGRPILNSAGGYLPIWFGLGVNGHGPCLSALSSASAAVMAKAPTP